jgi:transposase
MCRQDGLFDAEPRVASAMVTVNDRVCFRTAGTHRVVSVHGVVAAHYDRSDRAAEAYAMVTLVESGYADQREVARAFGYSSRSLRRYQERLAVGGVRALGRPRGRPSVVTPSRPSARDRIMLRLKAQGLSNRAVAQRLGVVERAIRKRLHRLGGRPAAVEAPSFFDEPHAPPAIATRGGPPTPNPRPIADGPALAPGPCRTTLDGDPRDRSMDRVLAAMGLLDDALPLFARTDHLSGGGVLLAVPALVASGVIGAAQTIYGSLGPAFYGLRTTVVGYLLLALLRIARPETLKEHAPSELGRIVGLDRMPEVKTLRRKLAQLAAKGRAQEFGREMARRRIRERGRMLGFLYVDGHVRAYHGTRRVAKAYLTRARITGPATTDYWVNDKRGDPLFVVTADANATMTRLLVPILEELRPLFARKRRLTVVFDRGGWSPRLFQQIVEMGLDLLTYRKGRIRHVAPTRFVKRRARLDGRRVTYLLHDQAVRLLKGKLRVRQVTRLTPETGHQTPIVTSRWDLRDIVIAYRMFERWRQENFFKYMRQEYVIDALTDYDVEPEDPERSVPNPARKAVDKELRQARGQLARLRESYGTAALDYLDGRTRTMAAFTEAEQRLQAELDRIQTRIAQLVERQNTLPVRVPLRETPHGSEAVKLSTERKHLTNVLKMVAYQIESTLVEQLRPYYARTDDEGRTFIQTALRGGAAIEPTADELRITLAPLSSPHRSAALRRLCEDLNKTATPFPGSNLRLCFAVAQSAPS